MRLFFHFAVANLSNTYLIGPDGPGEAILVDPGALDVALLQLIEGNGFRPSHVLVTHAHKAHINGIKTVRKVYDTKIYSMSPTVLDFETVQIHDGQQLCLAGINVSATHIPGHSSDSVIYRIGDWLFTGDVLYAGGIGKARTGYSRALMVSSLRERVMTMEDHVLVFPGHGPPSTIEAEKATNAALVEDA